MLPRKNDKPLIEKVLAALKKPEPKSGKGKKALIAAGAVSALVGVVIATTTEKAVSE